MAASRKLQGEIDRCLKKVAEGVEQFEDIWKKVHNATNSNQKEKYEADLKKEIKKLQRLRDQIKSWLQSGEIKDKTQLLENRKLIETQMERFKVVERETKTKAYSKEGLGAAQNKDPIQREREETNRWLSESIDLLNIQVDQFESEIESLLAAGKKKKIDKEKSDRVDDLRDWLEKHRFHIKKLEILMRMLNNESIDCEQIKKIKEDVEYYIESSQDPDYVENDGVYDDIDMEDLDYPTPEITVGKQHAIGSHESTDGSTPSSSVCGTSPAPSPAATTNNHSNDHSTNAAEVQNSPAQQQQPPPQSQQQSTTSSNSSSSTNSSSSHHERKRSNKADDSRSGSTPVKPQVVRPSNSCSNSTTTSSSSISFSNHSSGGSKPTPPPSTPTKPVSGNTSQSTPNNSSSSSGLVNHLISSPQINNRDSSHGNSNNNLIHNMSNSHTNSSLSSISISSSSSNSSSNSHSNTNGPTSSITVSTTISSSGGCINSSTSSSSTICVSSSVVPGPTLNSVGTTSALTTTSISNQLIGNSGGNSEVSVSLKAMAQKKLSEVNSTPSVSLGLERSGANLPNSISNNTNNNNNSNNNNNNSSSSTGSINSVIANSQSANNSLRDKSANSTATTEAHIPPLLGVAPLGPVHLSTEHKIQYERLQAAFFHMPHPSDSERFRLHFPRQPCQTPSYYPQVMVPLPLSDTVEFFQRLSTETLFFIFYYMEGTKAQYLAAKALKKQSWRFHTKYMMWFQRHEEPKAITDEFEQGTYIFFDYENWGQRKRENFIFEYRYLEDRDLN